MALSVNRPLNIERVYAHLADSSTAGSAWAVAPTRGKIVLLGSIIGGVVATANNVLTCEINGTAVTHPTWVQAFTSSAVGDVSEVVPTAANAVVAGDKIEFISSGAGDTNTVPTTFYADILVS
jgi:hypothetical protein